MEYLDDNLYNLNAFWQSFEHEKRGEFNLHTAWPNKIWRADFNLIEQSAWQKNVHVALALPSSDNYLLRNQLLAMSLDLKNHQGTKHDNIETITTTKQLKAWADCCSLAFGYDIDYETLIPLLSDNNATVLAYEQSNRMQGTAIAYKTGATIGVHQVGVPPQYQGKGIAKAMMQHLLWLGICQGCELMTLQASKAGLPIYLSMGFTELLALNHLAKNE